MSANGVDTPKSGRRRLLLSGWAMRIVIALILSILIVLVFFSSGAVSR
jgi:hypothetical protein